MTAEKQIVEVIVDKGYSPATVELKQGVPAELHFKRTSEQGCLDVVHSNELGFEENLPVNEVKKVDLPTDKVGEFDFSCGMDMFHGKVVIQ
ncbi:cupredoxin domain-containing protein [Lentilactobacillus sp. Marseille-Q4993]|uniref:cupredoxin domain-containing protein n=1 Tax=Lentilactobacillus sp. Marseille-Q4993 TaxID=3039492 RepID=UPI0024BD3201|nr:cupredoxin domain-containing protein [Lentilactobacillus sp. Marseille-Q4993]